MPLQDYVRPDGTVTLHHYTQIAGSPEHVTLDPERLGQNWWSKAEKRELSTPRTLFYLSPEHKENFFNSADHYTTQHPADKIYDLMADPKRIVKRMQARPPFNLGKTLHLLRRLGYHGVYYDGSFPTVAMMTKVPVQKKLARPPETFNTPGNPEPHLAFSHQLPGDLGHLHFTRTRLSPLHGPTWEVRHNEGKRKVFSGPEFAAWLNKLPSGHSVRKTVQNFLQKPLKLARIENDRNVLGLGRMIQDEDHHPLSSIHGILGDALEDSGDYRAPLVRQFTEHAAQMRGQLPPNTADASNVIDWAEQRKACRLAGGWKSKTLVTKDLGGGHSFHIRRTSGPKGHAFELQYSLRLQPVAGTLQIDQPGGDVLTPNYRRLYQNYTKVLSLPEMKQWLSGLDPDQRRKIFSRKPEHYRLARSGYGYCFECKAPFIRHDKQTSLVHCPNGHKRRYTGYTRRLRGTDGVEKLAATRAPTGGAIVNNQYHVGGQFLPRAFQRIKRVIQAAQKHEQMRALKLARKSPLSPEDLHAIRSPEKTKTHDELLERSVANDPDSPIPTQRALTTLAEVGKSTKGQYGHTGRLLSKFIGHDNAKLFAAGNAILSPLAPWEVHSRASMRLLRLWREAGSPKDEKSVTALVERINPGQGTEFDTKNTPIYNSINWPAKRKVLTQMLMSPQRFIKAIENVASTKRGKIVDFGRAHHDPGGVPIDTHQAKLTIPTKDQLVAHGGTEMKKLVKETGVSHRLVRRIAQSGDKGLRGALLDAQKKFIEDPAVYSAYKSAIAHAADQLGWEPREVQESVWTAAVALVACRNLGISPDKILQHLTHEDAFHGWNVGGLLTKPEALHDVSRLTKRSPEAFRAEANLPPAATGKIQVSDPAALEDAAARVSPGKTRGAWKPIQAALEGRRKPSLF